MLVRSTLKWAVVLGSLLAAGPAAGLVVGALRGPGGAEATTPLLAEPMVGGLWGVGAAVGLAAVMGLLGARFFGSRTGMTCAGLVLAWAAWSTGSLDALLAPARSAGAVRGVLVKLAVEGAVLGAVSLGLAAVILRVGARADAVILQEKGGGKGAGPEATSLAMAGLAALMTAGLVVWWVAFQPLKGQVVFAALGGAIGAAAAAHLMAPHLPARVSALIAFGAMGVLAAAGPVSAMLIGGPASARAVAAGMGSHLAYPAGLDWAAGAFLGVPIGLGWSGSMVEKHAARPEPAAAR